LVPLLARYRAAGIEIVALDGMDLDSSGTYQIMGTDGLMRMISSGKAAFLLSFDANSNRLDDQLTTVTRKAVELQVPVVLTPEEASALLDCMSAEG